jgi:hypothetical protein
MTKKGHASEVYKYSDSPPKLQHKSSYSRFGVIKTADTNNDRWILIKLLSRISLWADGCDVESGGNKKCKKSNFI